MQNHSANALAVRVTLILSLILIVLVVAIKYFVGLKISWFFLILVVPVFSIISFFILRNILFTFIYRKIRLIYKAIHTKKEDEQTKKQKFNINTDMLKQVDEDVTSWAEKNRKELQQWKHMVEYRKEFVGNVSHELKTPIFNIQGYALTLLEGGLEDPKINKRYLEKVEKNINRMISIVKDLEDISKLEHGQLELRWKELIPEDIAQEVIDNIEDKAKKKKISTQIIKHYDKKIKITADKEFLSQVITNLVTNAINYGKEGGFVKIELFDMDENIMIEVTDNGIGIAEEELQRVFERFYRVDKSRSAKSGGTGLGLAIVKHIIEAHGQKINVRSTPGVGTTFAFTMKKSD